MTPSARGRKHTEENLAVVRHPNLKIVRVPACTRLKSALAPSDRQLDRQLGAPQGSDTRAADMGAPSLDSLIAKIRASAAKDRSMAQALANASGAIAAASPPPPRYTPLSLTFVSYVQGDSVGKIAALVTLTPIFAHVALGSWILARRELHAACLFVGSVLNTALCIAIKAQARGSAWV